MYTFDLSPMRALPGEHVEFLIKQTKYAIYFGFCKPVENLPREFLASDDSTVTNAVLVKGEGFDGTPIAGEFTATAEIGLGGELRLKLTSRSTCREFAGENVKYVINVRFNYANSHGSPQFEAFNEEVCEFDVRWDTFLASPMDERSSAECSFTYKNHVFDLRPLKHPYFYTSAVAGVGEQSIKMNSMKVYINFCQPVRENGCSFQEGGFVSVCMKGDEKKIGVVQSVSFDKQFCKYDAKQMALKCHFKNPVKKGENTFSASPAIDINLICNRSIFSFKPIFHLKKNKITVTMKSFLVCLPENSCSVFFNNYKYTVPKYSDVLLKYPNSSFMLSTCGPLKSTEKWLGGSSSLVSIAPTVKQLGYLRTLQLNEDNSLSLILTGGSTCSSNERITTEIRFKCSEKTDVQPTLLYEKECYFLFEWRHSRSCPVPGAKGTDCVLRDPQYFVEYDLKNKNGNNSFIARSGDYLLTVNMCGDVRDTCNSRKNVSICLKKNEREFILGDRLTQSFMFDDRYLVFELSGEECRPGVNISIEVEVVCDFGVSDKVEFDFASFDDENCEYALTWKTAKACPSQKNINCMVTNSKGQTTDLSQLRRLSGNYEIPLNETAFILLNICGPLWYGKGVICLLDSAACLVSNGTFKNVGYSDGVLSVNENDQVKLTYEIDMLCDTENNLIGTSIKFECDHQNEGPYYIDYQNCKYNFGWRTRYACFSGENRKNATTMVSNGSSQIESSAAVGENNRMLSVGSIESETELSFVSFTAPESKISPSTLTADTKNLECKYNGGNKLRSLSELGRRGVSTDVTAKLHFSMVYHFTHVNRICSDSVSCLVFNNSFSINLGSTFLKPVYKSDDSMTINSISGSICDRLKGLKYSAVFTISCNRNDSLDRSNYIQVRKNICEYNLRWSTSEVCDVEFVTFDKKNCVVENKKTGEIIHLAAVFKNTSQVRGNQTVDGDSSNFLPNLCDIGQDRVRCPDSVHTKAPGFLDELPILDHVESIGHFNRTLNTTFIYINGTSCNSRGVGFLCDFYHRPTKFSIDPILKSLVTFADSSRLKHFCVPVYLKEPSSPGSLE
ncbi:hypothetical protein RUM43_002377 [Polyplax serrata]|uniref:MRH domain-containing protein n=1 Tax=Polyplax serrata TaxID=468196 RepID=A0AAN8PDT0_POLSC